MWRILIDFLVAEFKAYFDHVKNLKFEDRPDYDYLKRLFRELFFRKGFSYDSMYDWEIASLKNGISDIDLNESKEEDRSLEISKSTGYDHTKKEASSTSSSDDDEDES